MFCNHERIRHTGAAAALPGSAHLWACFDQLRLLRKDDQGSEYLRALLLPEIGAISQPAMLIAPRLPFQEGHKVLIKREGEEQRAVLNRRRTGTGNYNQFEYRSLGQVAPERETPVTGWKTHTAGGDEDFDSLWKSL